MSSVKIVNCALKRSGNQIHGEITYEATFTPSECSMNLAFIPSVVVRASDAFTEGIIVGERGGVPGMSFTVFLSNFRKEVELPLGPALYPQGQQTATTTGSFDVEASALFDEYTEKWTTWALDIMRLDLKLDFGPASCDGPDNLACDS